MYDLHSIENMNELAFIEGEKRRKEAEAARNKMKLSTWDWDVLTDKGNFHFAVVGRWRQNEALLRLKRVIHWLKLEVNEYVDGTHYKVPETNQCTILENPKAESGLGYELRAANGLWELMGISERYVAQLRKTEPKSRVKIKV